MAAVARERSFPFGELLPSAACAGSPHHPTLTPLCTSQDQSGMACKHPTALHCAAHPFAPPRHPAAAQDTRVDPADFASILGKALQVSSFKPAEQAR